MRANHNGTDNGHSMENSKHISRKLIPVILLIMAILLMTTSCGYEGDNIDSFTSGETTPVSVEQREGIPAPLVMFLDSFGNEIQINSSADIAGAYIRLDRGPGIESYWEMQLRIRTRRPGTILWGEWSEWVIYNDADRPKLGDEGDYEVQVRYVDPFSDPDNPPLLGLADNQLDGPRFILVELLNQTGVLVRDGDIIGDDVRASLPDKVYITIDGIELTPQIWITKESTGTIYKSRDSILLEVLEGYVNTYRAQVYYYDPDGVKISESEIITFTIDKQRPGKVVIEELDFVDEDGFSVPPKARTNRSVTLTVVIDPGDEPLELQYNAPKSFTTWTNMEMVDDGVAQAVFSVEEGETMDLSQLKFRLRDGAGNISFGSDEVVFDEGIVIDRQLPPAPDWDLRSNGNPVVDLVNSPVRLTARVPKGERFGHYEFCYDGNQDGTFSKWEKLPIGTSQDFNGADKEVTKYTVRIRYTDIAGNTSGELERSFTIDREPPASPNWSLLDENGSDVLDGRRLTIPVFLHAEIPGTELNGQFQYRVMIGDLESFSAWNMLEKDGDREFPGEENQTVSYTIQIRFVDEAGNSSSIKERTFTIDRKVPDAPAWDLVNSEGYDVGSNGFTRFPVELRPTRPEGEKIGVFEYRYITDKLDEFEPWTILSTGEVMEFDTELQTETRYTLEIRFRDEVGNTSEVSTRTFWVDKKAPESPFWNLVRYTYGVQVDSQEDVVNGPVRLYATAPANEISDGIFEFRLRINDGTFYEWTSLPLGYYSGFDGAYKESIEYTVDIRYRDTAGNLSPVRRKTFFVDRDIPASPVWDLVDTNDAEVFEDRILNLPVKLTARDPVNERGGHFEFSFAINDSDQYTDWIRVPVGESRWFQGVEDETTKYSIRTQYVDLAGNASPESERSFYIDLDRPAAPIWNLVDDNGSNVTNGQVIFGRAILTGMDPSYEVDGKFEYSYDDNRDGTFTDWTHLGVGSTTTFLGKPESKVWIHLKIRYTDQTGNIGVESEMQFKIDRTGAYSE